MSRPQLVVMKFGGTSVEDAAAIRRTAAIVRGRRERGLQPIVVVSAMAKVTDQLIAAAKAAGAGDKAGALALSARLRSRHLETAGDLVHGVELTTLLGAIQHDFDALDDLLRGISAVGELTPAHDRPCGQLWRAAFEPDRRGCIRDQRSGWRASGRAPLHRDRRPVRQSHPAGTTHGRAADTARLAADREGSDARHGRLHRVNRERHHHDPGPRRQRLLRSACWWSAARRCHRDLDGRQRHHDH